MKKFTAVLMLSGVLSAGIMSCSTARWQVTSAERVRLLADSRFDPASGSGAEVFIAPYKRSVDSIMSPVVGHSARYMAGSRPESTLSNLLADILVWAGEKYGEKPVMGLYNVGGIRAALPRGTVTYGDVLEIAPFENKICFLTLTGKDLLELFGNIAAAGGEGVSAGVRMEISADRRLLGVTLHGSEIDPAARYRIATIDYLAEGNDRMSALRKKTDFNSPQAESNDTRYIISDYFREMDRQGKTVDAQVEGRITVK